MEEQENIMPACRWNLVQFGLMCAYTMGLTAIWKFPYLVYVHTGLFLVAYYILLVVVCIPVTFIQLKLGAIFGRGIVGLFSHYTPALKGVAGAMLALSFVQCVYHNAYLSLTVYYMFASMQHPYPWSHASNVTQRISSSYIFFGKTAQENYYYNDVLQTSGSIGDSGIVPWHLGLCLLAAWLLTYAFICRGPSWFGKVIYVTSPLAIVLLFTLLIYSHTAIPTAHQALGHFFSEQRPPPASAGFANKAVGSDGRNNKDILTSELASPLTWVRALEQHVYSLGLWAGLLPTLGAHLGNKKPASNLTWLIVLLVHSMLPHLGTIAIAPFIHALAVEKHLPFEDVIADGTKLTFIVLPQAFTATNVHPFWAFLFYLFFLLFAIHQQAILLLVIMENIAESFPAYIKIIFKRREFFAAALCTFSYFLGLPHITQGGSYFSTLVEIYLMRGLWVVILFGIPPLVYAYAKLDAFHIPVGSLCMCIWYGFASLIVSGLFIFNNITFIREYVSRLEFPCWSLVLGWCLTICVPFIAIVAGFVHTMHTAEGSWKERLVASFRPAPDDLPRYDADADECDDITAVKGAVEGGTLQRRKQQREKLQQQRKEQQLKKQQNSSNPNLLQPTQPEVVEEEEEDIDAPLAETEVCIIPPENGEIAAL